MFYGQGVRAKIGQPRASAQPVQIEDASMQLPRATPISPPYSLRTSRPKGKRCTAPAPVPLCPRPVGFIKGADAFNSPLFHSILHPAIGPVRPVCHALLVVLALVTTYPQIYMSSSHSTTRNSSPCKRTPVRRALIIGIALYKNSTEAVDTLNTPHQDARDWAQFLIGELAVALLEIYQGLHPCRLFIILQRSTSTTRRTSQ